MTETKQSQTITIGDQPTKEDTLGFKPYVIAIAKFLTNPDTKPPLTISIEGEWGRGKSSFMKQLQDQILQEYKELEKEQLNNASWFNKVALRIKFKLKQKTQIVWFNAWRHDKAESLWAAFALSFVEQISTNGNLFSNVFSYLKLLSHRFELKRNPWKIVQRLGLLSLNVIISFVLILVLILGSLNIVKTFRTKIIPTFWDKDFDIALDESNQYICDLIDGFPEFKTIKIRCSKDNPLINILFFLVGTGLLLAGIGTLLDTGEKLIGNPKTDLTQYLKSPDYDKQIAFIEKFHEDFSKIVDAYAGKGEKVYVFIDDLDRCELGKSADLLQALNLMISNDPNLIFILGMDREKVAAAITFKQKDVLPYLHSIAKDNHKSEQEENHQLMKKLDYGFAFLEKFVQLSFSLPKPSKNTLAIFLKQLSSDKQQNSQEKGFFLIPLVSFLGKKFKPVRINLSKFCSKVGKRAKNSQEEQETTTQDNSTTTSEKKERQEFPIFPIIQKDLTPEDIAPLVKMVAPLFDYNPRHLKQYLNALKLRTYIAYYAIGVTYKKNSLTKEQIGKFTAITLKYPRLLRHLEKDHELLGNLEQYARNPSLFSSPNNSDESARSSEPTTNNHKTENVKVKEECQEKYWVDNNPQLKELLCYPRENEIKSEYSLANNKGIKKLLEVSPEQKLAPKYFKLRELFEAGKWKEADEETYQVMLKVADRETEQWLDLDSIDNFPCEDLRIIDHLWVEYSKGKFGFSVQKEIYESLGGTRDYNEKVWKNFCERTGWIKGGKYVNCSDLTYHLELAPKAHLPAIAHLPGKDSISGENYGRLFRIM